jgi:uncharacterized protein (DUF2147 family)
MTGMDDQKSGAAGAGGAMKRGLLGYVLLVSSITAAAAEPDVTGLWLTENGKAGVELFRCGRELCGRIAWLADPTDPDGSPKRDSGNPDPALRSRPLCGMTVITGLEPAAPGAWRDGQFYYPKHGRDYGLGLRRDGERLELRAYAGLEMLGRTEHWSRADPGLRGCPEN